MPSLERYEDHGHLIVYKRDGAVLHLPGRISFGVACETSFSLRRFERHG
jgi:hypothetical protein